jgi:hypothetical protein
MICDDAAEYVSALCDGATIPPTAAQHIAACPDCQARLNDYLALGVELRRIASLEMAAGVPSRSWTKPQNRVATWWQKGWGTMRIPRLAFAVLIAGILTLASVLAVEKVRAHDTGTVVLLNTVGPNGPLMDCPLSTLDKKEASCAWYGKIGSRFLSYEVRLLSRAGSRVQLSIRARTYPSTSAPDEFTPHEFDATPPKEVWFEPGERLKQDVTEVGTLTLTGEWMDHMPIFIGQQKQDLSPGAGELRLASPLLLKDKAVAGDLVGAVSGIFSTGDPNSAVWIYIPGQGSFLLSLLPMEGAVQAHVMLSRISFEEGGHSWEFVTGAPVSRMKNIWVLHQPDLKGPHADSASIGTRALVQLQPGVWVPKEMTY